MKIHIVADGPNQRGDTFNRLVADIFYALGYEQLRFNVHQSGREVDIIGSHRTENRGLVAECKAHSKPIGGDDLNKFAGVIDAERRKTKLSIEGYFISISGFKETAVQQEIDLGGRFPMLGPAEIVANLVSGRIIVKPDAAIAEASKWLTETSIDRLSQTALLAHESGWYWIVIYNGPGHQPSSYSVVHADGQVLQHYQANPLTASIESLKNLEYTGPRHDEIDPGQNEARRRYLEFLIREYGHITLEGLPADREAGTKKLRLENIYAPLTLEPIVNDSHLIFDLSSIDFVDVEPDANIDASDDDDYFEDEEPEEGSDSELVGTVLSTSSRLAVLGSPGSGKTTLLKRLAVAYAAPTRLNASSDFLPERNWLPLVIRCRNLGSEVSSPVLKIVEGLAARAEMPELASAFTRLVTQELRLGQVLVLVDGLDEISSPLDRATFVSQLRTFLGTYPSASLVVTSREFGFRAVAGAVASVCNLYRVGELTSEDVTSITLAWHREVVGPSLLVRKKATALANSILGADRVRRLAVNPLLLTTLLLVRRWLGELPRKRSLLYAKAIEVLLMTWNVEGHEPLDPDETLPQLAYAAFCMMRDKVQVVSHSQLSSYLLAARTQMPELLGYTRVSVAEFISRVEERSSLLSLSGHIIEDGRQQATYEFKHLTFQEYLAALAATQGFYPDRTDNEHLVDVLRPYITKQSWREVIPLAGILGGRESTGLVEHMIDMSGPRRTITELYEPGRAKRSPYIEMLAQCIADDVPLVPETLERAADLVLTQSASFAIENTLASRYGQEIYDIAVRGYSRFDEFAGRYGSALSRSYVMRGFDFDEDLAGFHDLAKAGIASADPIERSIAYLWVMHVSFTFSTKAIPDDYSAEFAKLRTDTCRRLSREVDSRVLYAGFWALCWLVKINKATVPQTKALIPPLWSTWRQSENVALQRQSAWTIWQVPLIERTEVQLSASHSDAAFLRSEFDSQVWSKRDRMRAALTMSYYLGEPWTDHELVDMLASERIYAHVTTASDTAWYGTLLAALGPRGQATLEKWRESRPVKRTLQRVVRRSRR